MQDGDAPEVQKKVMLCVRIMARSFAEIAKAEEDFQILDQLKDSNIWKILTNLLDANTGFHQACVNRVSIKNRCFISLGIGKNGIDLVTLESGVGFFFMESELRILLGVLLGIILIHTHFCTIFQHTISIGRTSII